MAADNGTGTTITFGTTGWAGNIVSLSPSGFERADIKTSHLGTAALSGHTYIPGDIFEPGELEIEFQVDTTNVTTATASAPTAKFPPYKGPAETITVTLPVPAGLTTGAKFASSGFVKSVEYDVGMEELITGKMTVKLSGSITHTNAA